MSIPPLEPPGFALRKAQEEARLAAAKKVNKVNEEISDIIEKGKQAEKTLNDNEKLARRWEDDFDWGGLSFCPDAGQQSEEKSRENPRGWVCKNDGNGPVKTKQSSSHAIVTPDEWKLVIDELNKIVKVSAKDYLEMIVYKTKPDPKSMSINSLVKYNTISDTPHAVAAYVPWGKNGGQKPDYTQIPKLKLVMPNGDLIDVNTKQKPGHIHMNRIELLIIPNVGDYVKHVGEYKKVVYPPKGDTIARARAGPNVRDKKLHYRQFEKTIYDSDQQNLGDDVNTVYERLGRKKNMKKGMPVHPKEQIELYIEEIPLDVDGVKKRDKENGEWKREWVSLSAVELVKEDDEEKERLERLEANASEAAAEAKKKANELIQKHLDVAKVKQEEEAAAAAAKAKEKEEAAAAAEAKKEEERLKREEQDEYLSRNDSNDKQPSNYEDSNFITYKSSIFSKSIKHENEEKEKVIESQRKQGEIAAKVIKKQQELNEKQVKYKAAQEKHKILINELEQLKKTNADEEQQLEIYRKKEDAAQEVRENELALIKLEKYNLEQNREREEQEEKNQNLLRDKLDAIQRAEQERERMKKELEEENEKKRKILSVERSKAEELSDSLTMIKTINVLDKKYEKLKNNVNCKNIFLNIFKKAYEYIGSKVISFNWMGQGPEESKKIEFLKVMDDVIKEVKEVKEVKEKGADMNIINNYNIFLDCIECIKMISKVKIKQEDLVSKESILNFWKTIQGGLNYNTFISYLKIKGVHNNTDDCLLSKTQAIPSSYNNQSDQIHGGSSYKRTPKKQRKRN